MQRNYFTCRNHQITGFLLLLIAFTIGVPQTKVGAQNITASITDHGLIDCFPLSSRDTSGNLYFCEASAVLYYNKTIYVGSDRDFPGASSLFTIPFSLPLANYGSDVKCLNSPLISMAKKWEDMSISPDQKYIFAITGFDRVKPGSHEWDAFNCMIYWSAGMQDSAKLVLETDSGGFKSSLQLRERILKTLASPEFPDGMPYFKTEGLAIIPDNRMLIGVRESGKNYEDFNYAFKILQVSYSIENGRIDLNDDLKIIMDIDTFSTAGIYQPLGLSSMEYDPLTESIYFLTSYEDNNEDTPRIGSYLWVLSLADLYSGKQPVIVRDVSGKPFHFTHKAEGITVVNSSTLLVICDDDRYLAPLENNPDVFRQPNQSVYYILGLQP